MDALTHGLIGVAVGGLSGQPISFDNPIYLAALLGSQAPDFDLIAMARGGMSYLKQHRAASHSLPGIVGWATLIAGVLYLFMPGTTFLTLWCWALAGALSHIVMDYFNTHGVALLWPLYRKRLSSNLLNVFDPILLVLLLSPYLVGLPMVQISLLSFAAIGLYLLLRLALRQKAYHWLRNRFADFHLGRLLIMPSLEKISYWDFVLETKGHYFVGRLGALYPDLIISTILPKQDRSAIMEQARKTTLAEFFAIFTPICYFEEQQRDGNTEVQIYDLRYFQKNCFLHSGIIVYEDENTPTESYVQSYGHKLKFPT